MPAVTLVENPTRTRVMSSFILLPLEPFAPAAAAAAAAAAADNKGCVAVVPFGVVATDDADDAADDEDEDCSVLRCAAS